MARSFVQLSMDERRVIARMHEKKFSQAEIARTLGRDRATICRELRRNFWCDRDVPIAQGYWHVTAQQMAVDRRRRYRKLLRDPHLCAAVVDRLKEGWSPEQISGRLRLVGGSSVRLSHETIYQYVYSPEGQDQQLARYLPERRRKRRPRYARKPRSLVFPVACAIRNRPDCINSRSQFGHWEADLMIFRKEHGSANIATVVERKSRYTVLFRNNDRRSKPIMNQLISHLAPLPAQARQSLTFDRGLEFISWRELQIGMGTSAWFCDPQAPWQKGTVENTNKRVRRYLPSETIVLDVSNQEIRSLCDRLNDTPRKCLGFQTPKEIFSRHLLDMESKLM
ncbi:IS30 family transposase [Neorhizobium sp. T786]|uniref:IS30 family transposase n=1 Tax=Pseudorhizobium xiangyangii TaxID=2883104 RepID=UPI001CFFD65A|nr:IS30 family transposase [Neorhizobium xiangyangii]MCB5205571.1 IS30 family transposase [Neorhizobium xiangyangii]